MTIQDFQGLVGDALDGEAAEATGQHAENLKNLAISARANPNVADEYGRYAHEWAADLRKQDREERAAAWDAVALEWRKKNPQTQ